MISYVFSIYAFIVFLIGFRLKSTNLSLGNANTGKDTKSRGHGFLEEFREKLEMSLWLL